MSPSPSSILFAVYVALHAAFIVGRFAIFRLDGPAPPMARVIEVSAVICIVAGSALILSRAGGSPYLDALALASGVISGALFVAGVRTLSGRRLTAAFSTDVPAFLITTGPYRQVRNPFYLAYLLCYVEALFASRSPWALLPLAWMTAIYWSAARQEERKFMSSGLALEFAAYQRSTGAFLPRISRAWKVRT
jgi:protein-S-isoprenylcysteine O-methyltransferase Ste14